MSSAGRDGSVQKRVSDQRARLLALDYHDPFTAESLSLVERLFEDLVTTTESYEDLQQREDQTAADLALSRAQLFPLKKENARLLRDNNLLHLKVIKAAEDASRAERSALLLEKRAEADREEARCLGAQKDLRMEELETQVGRLRESLASALDGATATATTATAHQDGLPRKTRGGGGKGLNGLEREMEVTGVLLAGSRKTGRRFRGGMHEEGMGDEDDHLSSVVDTLRERLEEASSSLAGMGEERARLERQVEAREQEIARLGAQIGGGSGSNLEQVTLAHAHEANQRIVDQLNDHVDFLNRQLVAREAQLSKAREESAAENMKGKPSPLELEVGRLKTLARKLEDENARLSARAAEAPLKHATIDGKPHSSSSISGGGGGSGDAIDGDGVVASVGSARGDGKEAGMAAVGEMVAKPEGWEVISSEERESARLEEALADARERVVIAEAAAAESAAEAENLRRRLRGEGEEGRGGVGMGVVEEVDVAGLERDNRTQAYLKEARVEADALRLQVSRLEAEAKGRTVYLDRLSRERQELMEKLKEASAAQGDAEQKIAGGAAREMEAEGRVGEEAVRLRATVERLSLAEQHAEFLVEEAAVARAGEGAADQRATLAEAKARQAELNSQEMERKLKGWTGRALNAEGEAAEARSGGSAVAAAAEAGGEGLLARLEASEAARNSLKEELERVAGRDSLLGVERFAQASRVEALERDAVRAAEDIAARERDVAGLIEQKRELEAEVSRAQRALSRGAVETASMAQAEMVLQGRLEEALDDVRVLRAEVGKLTDNLLAEERKATTARDEADRLGTRLSHRSAGFEGLEAEVASLQAGMAVARVEAAEREGVCARMEAESERLRSSVAGLEQQLALSKEALSDKNDEIRRLKALARQLECSRETLKASGDEARANLRGAELRIGQALSEGDGAKRDAEASRGEVEQLKAALAELDADRDRLQDTLDKQSERLAALQEADNRWRQKVVEVEKRLREEGSRCSDLERALEDVEKRASEAGGEAAEGLRKMEALSSELEAKTGQLAAATEDLEMMAKENQAVTGELARLGAERDDNRRKLGDALHQQATSEQATRAAQFEKEDLLKNYRGLHAEKRRLEAGVDELQLARQRLTKSLAERDAEVSKLRASATAVEVQLQRKTMDLGALQRQLLRGGRQVEALAAENRRLVSDARAQRHHANALLERIRCQQGHSTTANQEVNSLRARLQALEEERDGLSHILGRERSHGSGLEQLIEASRIREASVAEEQRQLAREKNRLEAKAAKLAEELAQARDCLADVSSRMSVSMSASMSRRSGVGVGGGSSSNDPRTPSTPASSGALGLSPAARVHSGGGGSGGGRVSGGGGVGGSDGGGLGMGYGLGFESNRDGLRRSFSEIMGSTQELEEEEGGAGQGQGHEEEKGGGRERRGRVLSSSTSPPHHQQQQQRWSAATSPQANTSLRGVRSQGSYNASAVIEPPGEQGVTAGGMFGRHGGVDLEVDSGTGLVAGTGSGSGGGAGAGFGGGAGMEGQEGDSGVFDLEDVRGFVRMESQRLMESVLSKLCSEVGPQAVADPIDRRLEAYHQ
eukprot:jgi/Undpi1/12578/HiC_scaffold_6.g02247.m1